MQFLSQGDMMNRALFAMMGEKEHQEVEHTYLRGNEVWTNALSEMMKKSHYDHCFMTTHTHTHRHTLAHACMCAHYDTNIYAHTHSHTCTHIHICTHTHF